VPYKESYKKIISASKPFFIKVTTNTYERFKRAFLAVYGILIANHKHAAFE